jgi:hypothetical protein
VYRHGHTVLFHSTRKDEDMKTLCLVLAASLVVRACSFNTLRLQRLAGRTVLPLARYQTVFSSPNSGDGESQFEEPTAMGLSRPPLDLQANAYQFFDNPVFYYNEWARQGGDAQRKEMFGEKTVEVVLQEITNLSDFMGLTGIRSDYVQAYLDDLPSPELKLHNAGTIALGSATEELERSEKTYTPLESTAALRQKVFEESTVSREQSIYYVLGPSGSGKTFFALNDISTHNVAHDKFATVYCRAGDAEKSVKFVDKTNGHELLIEWVKTKIQQDEPKVTLLKPLEMHITLILDEAGSSSLRGFFDKKESVTATYTALQGLATSVRFSVGCVRYGGQRARVVDTRRTQISHAVVGKRRHGQCAH